MTKSLIRDDIKQRILATNYNTRLADSVVINNKVVQSQLLKGNILVYNSLNTEVDTTIIVDYCLNNDSCNLFMPVVVGDDLQLVGINKDTKFSSGVFGIQEPIGTRLDMTQVDIDVCITPLVAFDNNKNRLGKGKGFYDRFFAHSQCLRIGVAFDFQCVSSVLAEQWDIPLDIIFTPTRTIK